jgi:hypothetical protein
MTSRPLNNWERRGERRRSRHLTNWEKRRDKKYVTEMVDEVRYTVNEENLELGRHSIHEEPPRSGKSEALCVESVADHLATHPNFKFGLITHSQSLGCKFVGATANRLRALGFEFEYERADSFKLKGSAGIDPSYWASGLGGGHTGKGANRLIISDVLRSGTDAMSQKIRENIITDVISTGMNRLEPYTADDGGVIPGAVTFEQARLHEGDPCGWAQTNLPQIVHCHFPAINDDGKSAWVRNSYTNEFYFAPAYTHLTGRTSREQLDLIKSYSTSYFWNCQYLMICGLGDMVYFILANCPRYERIPQVDCYWVAVDAANTATQSGSRTAFGAMGFTAATGKLSLLATEAGRWRVDEMGDHMVAFVKQMRRLTGRHPEAVLIERAAAGYGLIDRYSAVLPIVPVYPLGSKEDRAGSVCWIVNQGGVAIPVESPATKDWEAEVGGFPLATLNDHADVLTHLLSYALRPSEFKPAKDAGEVVVYDCLDDGGGGHSLDPDMDAFDRQMKEMEERYGVD